MVEGQVLTHSQTLTSTQLQVEVIRDFGRFKAISREWDHLAAHGAIDPVFVSHSWFRTWWETFGIGHQLHVITVRSNGRLVAAAPMMRTKANIYGLRANALHAIYNTHTPRYDFIVAQDGDHRLYKAIWDQLTREPSCDLVVIAQTPDGSSTISQLETLAGAEGWLSGQWVAPASPFIPLGCEYEAFFGSLRSGCRFNLIKRQARLRKLGAVDMEVVSQGDAIDPAMRDGLRIEAAAWKGAHGTAMLCDSSVTDFYIQLAKRQAELGQLRLTFLRVAGKRIAFKYILESQQKLYAIKIGYDPQFHAYSPGSMLLNLVVKNACSRGIKECDLLGGDDDWKFEWTKDKREHRWLFLFRNRFRPRLLHRLKFRVLPALKKWAL